MVTKIFSVLIISLIFISEVCKAQMPPPPPLQSGESWTALYSMSYDYQTNGSVRYIVQNPASHSGWCAIIMAQQDSTTAVGVRRYVYYSYSFDNGISWSARVLDSSSNNGFPCITLSQGIPVIALHGSSATGSGVYWDSYFGAFQFTRVNGVPVPSATPLFWPHIAGTTNGNLVLAASPNPGFVAAWSTYNGTSWSPWTDLPSIGGPSGGLDVAAGPFGRVSIIGTNYNGNSALSYCESTDNGITFPTCYPVMNYIILEGDTLYANIAGGFQGVYDSNGNIHIAFAAYNINSNAVFPNPNTLAYIKPSIYHWSSQTSTFTRVAGKFNIPNLADTITTALIEPLCHPTITRTASGKLVCAYSTYLRSNTQVVQNGDTLNAGEIFMSASGNNGSSWSTPQNITNTTYIEEKHPSLSPDTYTDSLRIFYVRDMLAGGWVNIAAWGKAPVYGIFKSGSIVLGVNENISEAKTYILFQNYPNPFNPKTIINYSIPSNVKRVREESFGQTSPKRALWTNVKLVIYNALGKEIATLVNERQYAGSFSVKWDASNYPSGVYYYSLTAGDFKDTKRMVLLK